MSNAEDTETSQLLSRAQDDTLGATGQSNVICSGICDPTHVQDNDLNDRYSSRVLPIAFTAAFAIAATSATTIFAYASIVCVDPAHCREGEKDRYTGVVALATVVANTFGVIAVGVLRQWVESNPKLGLYFWIFCRALGIGSLAVGVVLKSIHIAIAGRLFEGLATDNILQYALAAIYIRTKEEDRFSRLMGTSMALYMSGMSMGPTIVTLLPNFFLSFVVAISLLAISFSYLWTFVPLTADDPERIAFRSTDASNTSLFEPIYIFYREPLITLPALSILLYNCAQAYLFPLIMVHATLKFGFTSVENGYLISVAAASSSVYLLFALCVVPKMHRYLGQSRTQRSAQDTSSSHEMDDAPPKSNSTRYHLNGDFTFALLSMSVQLAVLPCFTTVQVSEALYGLVALIALGLGAPSFIKSHAVMVAQDRDSVVAGLAVAESMGGLVSPMVLGAAQSLLGQESAFIMASSIVGAAILCLVGSLLAGKAPALRRSVSMDADR